MSRSHLVTVAVAAGLVASVSQGSAQEVGADKVAAAMVEAAQGRFAEPFCSARKAKDKGVQTGTKALKTAIEDKDAAKRAAALDQALGAFQMATTTSPAEAGGFYYLGRAALMKGDVTTADAALTRAQSLADDCEVEITQLRQIAWIPLVNEAIQQFNAEKLEDAIPWYRAANRIFRGLPQGFNGLGLAYARTNQLDSAAVYLKKAVEASGTPDLQEERNSSQFNLGLILTQANRPAEAVPVLEQYVQWVPNDMQGRRALAVAYRGAGMGDKASAMEKELLAAAGTAAAGGAVSTDDLFAIGATLFNEKKYAEAAEAFGKIVALEPNNRDALFNQTNCYLGAENGKGMLESALKLLELDPLNETVQRLVMEGYRRTGQSDQLLKIAEALVQQPVNLEVKTFKAAKGSAAWSAVATGRDAQTPAGQPVKPKAGAITLEFLDAAGAVLATQELAIPALEAGKSQPLTAEAKVDGVKAWRYKVKA